MSDQNGASAKICIVHGDEINHFSWCDDFTYCEAGWEQGADYTCHSIEYCKEWRCHGSKAAAEA